MSTAYILIGNCGVQSPAYIARFPYHAVEVTLDDGHHSCFVKIHSENRLIGQYL